MIKVIYSNGEEATFDNVYQAQEAIKMTVLGCDFAVTVAELVEIEDGNIIREYGCQWNVEIIPLILS
jgi:hypothetical protein